MSFRNDPAKRERALVQAVGRFLESRTPEGPILVVGDPSPAVAELLRSAGLEALRWHRAMTGRTDDGAVISPWPPEPLEGGWRTVALRLSRSKEELEMLLHAAASRLAPGGELLVYGANDEGIKSADAVIEPLFGKVETDTVKSRCRVLRAKRPDGPWPAPIRATVDDWKSETELEVAGRVRPWISYPGVFSHGRFDAGTRLLLESVGAPEAGLAAVGTAGFSPAASILDYGCGSGLLAAGLVEGLAEVPAEGRADLDLHLLDPDTLALEAARANLPGARIHEGASMDAVGDLRFDLIASNPPYHRGKVEDPGVVEALIRDAPGHLVSRGALVLVVQRRLPVEGMLRAAFGRVEILGEDGTYRVWGGRMLQERG